MTVDSFAPHPDSTIARTFAMQELYGNLYKQYLARGIDRTLDPSDTETAFDQPWKYDHYYDAGADALRNCVLALIAGLRQPPKTILDLPSGSGRVTRHLRAFFPDARIVACDLYDHHWQFCARQFGVEGVVSKENFDELDIGQFDLIFCGSLLTHLPDKLFESCLRMFSRSLTDTGVAVVTTHGRHVEFSQHHKYAIIQRELFDVAERAVAETGFGYVDYKHDLLASDWDRQEHYGVTLSRPRWVMNELERDYGIRILTMTERGWDCGQDVIAFCKPGVNAWMRTGDVNDPAVIGSWQGPKIG